MWRKKRDVEFSWNSVYEGIQSKATSCPLTSRMQPVQLQQVWTALFATRARTPADDAEADKLVNLFVSCFDVGCDNSKHHMISLFYLYICVGSNGKCKRIRDKLCTLFRRLVFRCKMVGRQS